MLRQIALVLLLAIGVQSTPLQRRLDCTVGSIEQPAAGDVWIVGEKVTVKWTPSASNAEGCQDVKSIGVRLGYLNDGDLNEHLGPSA